MSRGKGPLGFLVHTTEVVGGSAGVRRSHGGRVRQRRGVGAADQTGQAGGAAVSTPSKHGPVAAVELREVVPGVGGGERGARTAEYYGLPFGGVEI